MCKRMNRSWDLYIKVYFYFYCAYIVYIIALKWTRMFDSMSN